MDSASRGPGGNFYPLAIEAGGTLNAHFHEFLQILAVASSPSPSERASFLPFALQRIRAVSPKKTCAIILARPVSRTAPGGVHRRGALPLIQPKPRPRSAAFLSPPPRPQSQAVWAGAFPRRPDALGPSRGACSCGHPSTPSTPDAELSQIRSVTGNSSPFPG